MYQIVTPRSIFMARVRPYRRLYSTIKTSTVDWKPIKTAKTPGEGYQKQNQKWTKKIFLGLMIAMPIVSFYLGTWQLRRLKWKTNLIAACEDRLLVDETPLPKKITPEMSEHWEYRRCTVTGKFLHDEELFVGPRVRNGVKGYILYTPFIRKDTGEKLLIERGWISEDKVVPTKRHLTHLSIPESDNVTLSVLVRVAKDLTMWQWKKEDRESRLWQVLDFKDMCETVGATPIYLQAIYDLKDHHWEENSHIANETTNNSSWKFWGKNNKDNKDDTASVPVQHEQRFAENVEFSELQFMKAGVPIGKVPKLDLKNNHLQYLITWYGLSFLSSIFLVFALKRTNGSAVSQSELKRQKLRRSKSLM